MDLDRQRVAFACESTKGTWISAGRSFCKKDLPRSGLERSGLNPPSLDVEPKRASSDGSLRTKSFVKSALVLRGDGKRLDGVMPQLETRAVRVACALDAGFDRFPCLCALGSHPFQFPLVFVPEAVVHKPL
jgi:hypothetical protein